MQNQYNARQKHFLKGTGTSVVPTKKDETDHKIEKLQNINSKLMSKMKELNVVLENTLDKANNKKIAKMNKETNAVKTDVGHQIKVKEVEVKNTSN